MNQPRCAKQSPTTPKEVYNNTNPYLGSAPAQCLLSWTEGQGRVTNVVAILAQGQAGEESALGCVPSVTLCRDCRGGRKGERWRWWAAKMQLVCWAVQVCTACLAATVPCRASKCLVSGLTRVDTRSRAKERQIYPARRATHTYSDGPAKQTLHPICRQQGATSFLHCTNLYVYVNDAGTRAHHGYSASRSTGTDLDSLVPLHYCSLAATTFDSCWCCPVSARPLIPTVPVQRRLRCTSAPSRMQASA